jgi:hypothetical protein
MNVVEYSAMSKCTDLFPIYASWYLSRVCTSDARSPLAMEHISGPDPLGHRILGLRL